MPLSRIVEKKWKNYARINFYVVPKLATDGYGPPTA